MLAAHDADERARRAQRLGVIEATFDPLPIDAAVAREWGRLAATVSLMTHNAGDFELISDIVTVQTPCAGEAGG